MIYNDISPFISELPTQDFKRGEIIYNEGDHPEKLYIVLSGMVGLFHISVNGKETFLRVFGEKCIFGHRSYLAESPYHGTTMALKKSKVAIINKSKWQNILSSNPNIIMSITKKLATDLGQAELRLSGLIDKTATARIIEGLLFLKLKYPEQVWTRKEIAEFSGSTFETVARVMGLLDEKGLIIKDGRDFSIPNTENLLDFSQTQV